MKNNLLGLLGRTLCAANTGLLGLLLLTGAAHAAAFTPGNLVVLRVGDGIAALGSASCAVFLDEYTTAGVFVQTIAMPTAPIGLNFPLTNSGTATSEGFLNLSSNGQYLVNFGYGVAPGTASIAGTTSAMANRVVGRIDLLGNIDTTTAFNDLSYSGGNPRSATSDNGTQFWTTGPATATAANGGLRYATLGATTSAQVSISLTNLRVVGTFGTDMFVTSASAVQYGLSSVVPGFPTAPGAVINILTGFPTATGPSSYDFFFASTTTVYVADDRISGTGGIQRWDYNGTLLTWGLTYTLALNATTGCRGLTGVVDGAGIATLYATTHQGPANQIVTVTDTGPSSLVTPLATPVVAAALTGFRGIRLLPGSANTPFQPYCSGDGTDTACPCANPGLAGRGCNNSAASGGGLLTSTGIAQVSADTLVLHGSFLNPFGPGLYYQGSAPVTLGIPFGHGLRCAGGMTPRIQIVVDNGVLPDAAIDGMTDTTVSVSAFGAVNPLGGTYYYQLWYRDTPLFGTCMSGFNFTNAIAVTWAP